MLFRCQVLSQKAFSQAATSQGYFPKWQLPKCQISQATTSQVCPSRSVRPPPIMVYLQRSAPYPILAAALGHPLQPAMPQRPYPNLRKVAHFGSRHYLTTVISTPG